MSVFLHDKIIGKAPEFFRVCDSDHLHSIVFGHPVGRCWMVGENLCLLSGQRQGVELTLVAHHEEILVEIAFHQFGLAEKSRFDYIMVL